MSVERGTIIAGFGGQGLLFAGHVLAQAAVIDDLTTSWMPSYGPEMRGGTASCTVIVADRPIGSPIVDVADALIALNRPSLARYEPTVAAGGLIVVDSALVDVPLGRADVEVVSLPCTELAREAGDDRIVSVVALGALIARRPIVRPASIRQAIVEVLGPGRDALAASDLRGFEFGFGWRGTALDDEVASARSPTAVRANR